MKNQKLLTGAMLGVALATSSACHDPSGPKQDQAVVSVSVAGTPSFAIGHTIDGYPLAVCDVSLRAHASGSGSVTWRDATFYYYTGLDRTKTQDSAVVQAPDVQSDWGSSAIAAADSESGGWEVSDGLPFDLEIAFRYSTSPSGPVQSARTRFTCGPAVPKTTVAAPTLSQVGLGQQSVWQPSDTLRIQYQASSAVGMWLTYVGFADAFTGDSVFGEGMQPSTQRLVKKPIPAAATLSVPATVAVFALDPFGQLVSQIVQTPPLVDIKPPVVQLEMFPPPTFAMTPNLGGGYFVGDSIDFVPFVGDNHVVQSLVWHADPGNFSDSIAPSALGTGTPRLFIPVHPEWLNGVQFRFYAIDPSGNVSDTVKTAAGAFRVYQTVDRPTITAAVSGDVNGAVIDTARSLIYVLQSNQNRIAIFSLATLRQTGTIPVPGFPQSLDMTPGGDSLIVSLYQGQLAVIDLRNTSQAPTVIRLADVDTLGSQHSGDLRVAANDRVYVLRGGSGGGAALLEVDLTTGAQRIRSDAGIANGIVRSLDQKVLVIAGNGCVERYDVATDVFGSCTALTPAIMPTVDRTGQSFGAGLTALDAAFAPVATVQSPWNGLWILGTTISADGAYIYSYYGLTGLTKARVSDGAILDRTIVPAFDRSTGFFMQNSPDGTKMLLGWDEGVSGTGQLTLVDLRDADAQPFQVARARRSAPTPSLQSTMAPAASHALRALPWRARPPAPRPWRGAATTAPRDPGRS